ncbi:MAG: cell wall hydrolase [Caulobacteraceae bacterium]|nr:cell wall hydrolase [Caulobacteraceae bacterium]
MLSFVRTRLGARGSSRALAVAGIGLALGAFFVSGRMSTGSADAAVVVPLTPEMRQAFAAPLLQPISTRPAQARALVGGRDLDCLAAAVYYEARGESAEGQEAVAQVVLNRVRSPAFPNTVCGVVYQGATRGACQFSFACDGQADNPREPKAWAKAKAVAGRALAGHVMSEVGRATHFRLASLGADWGDRMVRLAQVGQHIFFAFSGRHGPAKSQPSVLASKASPLAPAPLTGPAGPGVQQAGGRPVEPPSLNLTPAAPALAS